MSKSEISATPSLKTGQRKTEATERPCLECSDCDGEHHWHENYHFAEEEPEHLAAKIGFEDWETCKHCDAWRADYGGRDRSAPYFRIAKRFVVSKAACFITCTKCGDNVSAHDGLSVEEIKAFYAHHAHPKNKTQPVPFVATMADLFGDRE